MNVIDILKIEIPGIKKILGRWSRSVPAYSMLLRLEENIEGEDKDLIYYCLSELVNLYEGEIHAMYSAQFSVSVEDHQRAIKVLRECLTIEVCDSKKKNGTPLIFLSHRSSDKQYGDLLEKFLMGLGIKKEQLIYSSHPLHKIPLDKNIYDYLRENIARKVFMIILWSNQYLESPACLNEMGAAWVVQCDYTNIYVPTFDFGNPKYHECAVDTRKMGAILKNDNFLRTNLLELKEKVSSLFEIEIDEKETQFLIDEFVDGIKKIDSNSYNII